MPAVLTDILISMDDKYLYLSCWVHGDLRQYDITDIKNPKLTGQVFLGGCITKEFGVKVTEDKELTEQPQARYIQGILFQFFTYRISANSLPGNFSFLNLTLCTVTLKVHKYKVHRSAETIQWRKLFADIW